MNYSNVPGNYVSKLATSLGYTRQFANQPLHLLYDPALKLKPWQIGRFQFLRGKLFIKDGRYDQRTQTKREKNLTPPLPLRIIFYPT